MKISMLGRYNRAVMGPTRQGGDGADIQGGDGPMWQENRHCSTTDKKAAGGHVTQGIRGRQTPRKDRGCKGPGSCCQLEDTRERRSHGKSPPMSSISWSPRTSDPECSWTSPPRAPLLCPCRRDVRLYSLQEQLWPRCNSHGAGFSSKESRSGTGAETGAIHSSYWWSSPSFLKSYSDVPSRRVKWRPINVHSGSGLRGGSTPRHSPREACWLAFHFINTYVSGGKSGDLHGVLHNTSYTTDVNSRDIQPEEEFCVFPNKGKNSQLSPRTHWAHANTDSVQNPFVTALSQCPRTQGPGEFLNL